MSTPADARPVRAHPAPFEVEVRPERDIVRVVPVGELDLATAALLERELHDLRDSGFEHVVLDMHELSFIDSSGIRVVLCEHRFAQSGERRFSLVGVPPVIHRALEVCGLLEHLDIQSA
jgi:anti-sigma B factor antagonist